jgi:uncharacterized membrane protein YkvA (DUF1232 family)
VKDEEVIARTEVKLRSERLLHSASFLFHNIRLLITMLRDRSFDLTWGTRGLIVGALLYFIIPTDATPDYIPFVGYLDDTAIVAAVIKRLAKEIDRYKEHTAWS